jgi:hypothetical protein
MSAAFTILMLVGLCIGGTMIALALLAMTEMEDDE